MKNFIEKVLLDEKDGDDDDESAYSCHDENYNGKI